MERTRVIIADDESLIRMDLREMLTNLGYLVVGEVADGRSALLRFEDKFGDWARLSRNQKLARAALGENFILYHFTPADVARIAGVPSGILGRQVTRRSPDQP